MRDNRHDSGLNLGSQLGEFQELRCGESPSHSLPAELWRVGHFFGPELWQRDNSNELLYGHLGLKKCKYIERKLPRSENVCPVQEAPSKNNHKLREVELVTYMTYML